MNQQLVAQKSDYIQDEATIMVCEDLQITKTRVSNGTAQCGLECQSIVNFQQRWYCVIKGTIFSLSRELQLDKLPYSATVLAASPTKVYGLSSQGHILVFNAQMALIY